MSHTISTADLRRRLAETLNRASYAKSRFVIERNGRPVAAIISYEDLKALEALEDAADAAAADEALREGKSIRLSDFLETLRRSEA